MKSVITVSMFVRRTTQKLQNVFNRKTTRATMEFYSVYNSVRASWFIQIYSSQPFPWHPDYENATVLETAHHVIIQFLSRWVQARDCYVWCNRIRILWFDVCVCAFADVLQGQMATESRAWLQDSFRVCRSQVSFRNPSFYCLFAQMSQRMHLRSIPSPSHLPNCCDSHIDLVGVSWHEVLGIIPSSSTARSCSRS